MLIAIDHGNKNTNTNTVHHIFTSGLTESDTRSPFGDTVLQIGEKDFALRLARLLEKKSVSAREMSLAIGQNAGYLEQFFKFYAIHHTLPQSCYTLSLFSGAPVTLKISSSTQSAYLPCARS